MTTLHASALSAPPPPAFPILTQPLAPDDLASALRALSEQNYSIFLMDLMMPQLGGMALMEEIQKRNFPVTVIVMTGQGSIDQAVQAMRLGAYDILTKPVDLQHVRLVVQRVLRERRMQDEVFFLGYEQQDGVKIKAL